MKVGFSLTGQEKTHVRFSDANSTTFNLAGDLRFFASSPTLPLLYINLLLFTSTINVEYLVKNETDLFEI